MVFRLLENAFVSQIFTMLPQAKLPQVLIIIAPPVAVFLKICFLLVTVFLKICFLLAAKERKL